MNDAISRAAALATVEKMYKLCEGNLSDYHDLLVACFTDLTPAQRWIPWGSGKFPEESGTYTVTAYDGATKRVTYAKYQKRLKRWELTGARAYWRVLAWQPKPKPWEGGEE